MVIAATSQIYDFCKWCLQPAAAWYFSSFVGHLFAAKGEKMTYKGQEIRGLRKFYNLRIR